MITNMNITIIMIIIMVKLNNIYDEVYVILKITYSYKILL